MSIFDSSTPVLSGQKVPCDMGKTPLFKQGFWSKSVAPRTQAKYDQAIEWIGKIWGRYFPQYTLAINVDGFRGQISVGSRENKPLDKLIDVNLRRNLNGSVGCVGSIITYPHMPDVISVAIHYDLKGLDLVDTIAHELRHVWQKMTGFKFDYEAKYADSPQETDARIFAKRVTEEFGLVPMYSKKVPCDVGSSPVLSPDLDAWRGMVGKKLTAPASVESLEVEKPKIIAPGLADAETVVKYLESKPLIDGKAFRNDPEMFLPYYKERFFLAVVMNKHETIIAEHRGKQRRRVCGEAWSYPMGSPLGNSLKLNNQGRGWLGQKLVEIGSWEWQPLLEEIGSFSYCGVTIRKELRNGCAFWYAFRKVNGKTRKIYCGKSWQFYGLQYFEGIYQRFEEMKTK